MTAAPSCARSASAPTSPRSPATTGRALAALLAGRDDGRTWRSAAEIAGAHGMLPLLADGVTAARDVRSIPADVHAMLEAASAVAGLRAEARRRQLGELLTALAAADVPTIVLKGSHLAEHLYASPRLRPMSDVDLLVPPDAATRAAEVLTSLGFAADGSVPVSDRHLPPYRRRGRLPVEVHLTIEPCIAPLALRLADVWERAVTREVAGAHALALAPEDLLIHLATHMGRSHVLGASLVSVCDVHAWAERFAAVADWDALVARARATGARRYVYGALALAARTLAAPIPAVPLAALATPADERIVRGAARLLVAPPFVVLGAKAMTDPRDGTLDRAGRVGRALLRRTASRSTSRANGTRATPSAARSRDGRGSPLAALGALLLRPTAAWRVARHVAEVRALRRWSAAAP